MELFPEAFELEFRCFQLVTSFGSFLVSKESVVQNLLGVYTWVQNLKESWGKVGECLERIEEEKERLHFEICEEFEGILGSTDLIVNNCLKMK